MQLRSALLAATVLAAPFAASAQPVTGLYVGAGAGVNLTQKGATGMGGCQQHRPGAYRDHTLTPPYPLRSTSYPG